MRTPKFPMHYAGHHSTIFFFSVTSLESVLFDIGITSSFTYVQPDFTIVCQKVSKDGTFKAHHTSAAGWWRRAQVGAGRGGIDLDQQTPASPNPHGRPLNQPMVHAHVVTILLIHRATAADAGHQRSQVMSKKSTHLLH